MIHGANPLVMEVEAVAGFCGYNAIATAVNSKKVIQYNAILCPRDQRSGHIVFVLSSV